MTGPLVLAVDCSTTAAKAVLFDEDGHELDAASTGLDLTEPAPGHHEQDARQWWTSTAASIGDVTARTDPSRLAAVCVTHQRESFVCLDAGGQPLAPAVLWLDTRARAEIAELGSDHVRDVSGKVPDTTCAFYKIAWLARHRPDVVRDAAVVQEVHGYLMGRLTGRRATSVGSADSLGMLDLQAGTWSDELIALAGLRRPQVVDLVDPGTVLGHVTPAVAGRLGLPAGLPVVAGIGDGQAAGLGSGALEPGTAYLNLGTSMVLGTASTRYATGPEYRTLAGGKPGTYVLETVLNAAAYLMDWFRRELGTSGTAAVDPDLEAAAARVPPGADGLVALPYWNAVQTPHWDPAARGAIVGLTGVHTRAHIYRALLESVAYELRTHLDALERATGVRITSLRAMGGGSRSALWRQIVADVTGRDLWLCEGTQISARGAAVLAWAGLGRDVREVSRRVGRLTSRVRPQPSTAAAYADAFSTQQLLYPQLRDVFSRLAPAG